MRPKACVIDRLTWVAGGPTPSPPEASHANGASDRSEGVLAVRYKDRASIRVRHHVRSFVVPGRLADPETTHKGPFSTEPHAKGSTNGSHPFISVQETSVGTALKRIPLNAQAAAPERG